MQLSGIKPGDIVKCDRKGQSFFAEVTAKDRGRLEVAPLNRAVTWREVTARQVVAHYRKSKASDR